MSESENIVGVWDFAVDDCRIGSIFIYLVELNLICNNPGVIYLLNSEGRDNLVALFKAFSKHEIVLLSSERELPPDCQTVIHTPETLSKSGKEGSFLWLGELLGRSGLSRLAYPDVGEARGCTASVNIVVHLKNVPHDPQSNAHQPSWLAFFEYAQRTYPHVHFQLIGDDHLDAAFLSLSNIKKRQGSIVDYFSSVLNADGFLGMASAFSSAAILSARPYRIWKHEGHHPTEMARELNGNGQFDFHMDNQKFIIGMDTMTAIVQEFEAMLLAMKA